ncbi:MAG: hypothetical protein ACXVZX_15635 [Terriglobales bacterium]
MMYAVRGLSVALSVFVLVYALTRLAVECSTPLVVRHLKRGSSLLSPNTWYAVQVGPFLLATLVTCLFAVPSFIRFEPSYAEEEFGLPVLFLSLACVTILAAGLYRAWAAYSHTVYMVRQWRGVATPVSTGRFDVLQTGPDAPAMVVAGLFRPKLLVSSTATTLLSRDELTRAMAHECSHIRNYDNAKKLILRVCSFPPSRQLERNWLEAIEIAADREAVTSKREALELASALVKASRLSLGTAELASNLATDAGELLHTRVERLLDWNQNGIKPTSKLSRVMPLFIAATTGLALALSYQHLLLQMHYLAELLMR